MGQKSGQKSESIKTDYSFCGKQLPGTRTGSNDKATKTEQPAGQIGTQSRGEYFPNHKKENPLRILLRGQTTVKQQ
jgi:hypothetical protein